jgi:hypothetical protein
MTHQHSLVFEVTFLGLWCNSSDYAAIVQASKWIALVRDIDEKSLTFASKSNRGWLAWATG